jgi:hypothetical protein
MVIDQYLNQYVTMIYNIPYSVNQKKNQGIHILNIRQFTYHY